MKHKWYNEIVEFAEGHQIESRYYNPSPNGWTDWKLCETPHWSATDNVEYRVYDPYREFKEAFEEGKTIQVRIIDEWIDIKQPNFGASLERYRIKPEPEYIPFDFSDAEHLIGKSVKQKNGDLYSVIIHINKNYLGLLVSCSVDYVYLFNNYTFLDGSPCGKLKQ